MYMAAPGICVLFLADTCASEVHPVFNPVAPYCCRTCICLLQISQIQTRLFNVVGPGLVSTSPAFVRSRASHPAGPHGRLAQKMANRAPIAGGGKVRHNLHRCESYTACRRCRLEPLFWIQLQCHKDILIYIYTYEPICFKCDFFRCSAIIMIVLKLNAC